MWKRAVAGWVVLQVALGCIAGGEREGGQAAGASIPGAGLPDGRVVNPGTGETPPGAPWTGPHRSPPQDVEEPPPAHEGPFALPPLQDSLEEYRLEMAPAHYAAFHADPWRPEAPAVFVAAGQRWQVQVRVRGSSARTFPKKGWRVSFAPGESFQGRDDLHLISEYHDRTQMTEKLGYDLLRGMGVPAPRARFVRLVVNGVYHGVYVDLEHVDKHFVKAHRFADRDASVYRCGSKDCEMKTWRTSYQGRWYKRTNEAEPFDDVHALMRVINHTPEPQLEPALERHLELERYLRYLAMDALISNATLTDSGSFFIHDRVSGRWTYVPWDVNNCDARFWHTYDLDQEPTVGHPLFNFSLMDGWVEKLWKKRVDTRSDWLPAFSSLTTRIALHPRLRERALAVLERALDELYRPEAMEARIDQMYALLAPHVAQDPHLDAHAQAQFRAGRRYLKDFVRGRARFLREQLAAWRAHAPTLLISGLEPREGWVELANVSGGPVQLGELVLTRNLRKSVLPQFIPRPPPPPPGSPPPEPPADPGPPDEPSSPPPVPPAEEPPPPPEASLPPTEEEPLPLPPEAPPPAEPPDEGEALQPQGPGLRALGLTDPSDGAGVLPEGGPIRLPSRTLQPGERVRLSEAQLGVDLALEGEVGVFDGRSPVGVLDAFFYGALPAGQRYVRSLREPYDWRVE